MKLKGTTIFALVVGALMAYAYFIEFRGQQTKEKAKQEQSKLIPEKVAEVASFTGQNESGAYEVTRLESASEKTGEWKVTSPAVAPQTEAVADRADETAVDEFLNTLVSEKSEEVIAEGNDIKFDLFGLGKGARQIALKFKDGQQRRITVSTETGVNGKRYVRINDENRVLLVNGGIWNQLEKTASNFRDRRLFHRVFGDVEDLRIFDKNLLAPAVHLQRKEKSWVFGGTSQPSMKVDASAIEAYIGELRDLRAVGFASEEKNNPLRRKQLGLDQPVGRIEIRFIGGGQWSMEFSREKEKRVFTTVEDRNGIFEIGSEAARKLLKAQRDFRDRKSAFEFNSEKAQHISIKTPKLAMTLKKNGSAWTSDSVPAEKEIDQSKVAALLKQLHDLRAYDFLPSKAAAEKLGLKNSITLTSENGETLWSMQWAPASKDGFVPTVTSASDEGLRVVQGSLGALPLETIFKDKAKAKPATPTLTGTPAPTRAPEAK